MAQVKQLETEQWVGSEWGVYKDGKLVYSVGADEGKLFGRERCWLYVLFHPAVWLWRPAAAAHASAPRAQAPPSPWRRTRARRAVPIGANRA